MYAASSRLEDKANTPADNQFLSYLPSNHNEPPPQYPVPAGSGADMDKVLDILPASNNQVYDVIDPHDTRDWLIRMLEVHRLRMSGGVGQHLMRTWPRSY